MVRGVFAIFVVLQILIGSSAFAQALQKLPIAAVNRTPSAAEAVSAEDAVTDAAYCQTCNGQAPGLQLAVLKRQLATPVSATRVSSNASPSEKAMELMRAIIGEAARDRIISHNKVDWLNRPPRNMHLDPRRRYSAFSIWGKTKSFTESKGYCSMAVQAALSKIGITLGRGDAYKQVGHLAHTRGLVRTNLRDAPGGSVVACGGTKGGLGHIEVIVTNSRRQRLYCSDFCTTEPICGKSKGYGPANVFKLEGT